MMWKTIKNYNDYEINDNGDVRNIKSQFVLKPFIDDYESKVMLVKDNKICVESVLNLMGNAFLDKPDDGIIVTRINNDYRNNRKSNLKWMVLDSIVS